MKKTLLAAATLSALMASGMANAAFTDADGSGSWTGNLEFNGAITNTNPAWKYQIPEATIAGAKNWNVKRSDGTVDGSNTNFSFTDKNFTVLEGVMKAPAPTGGAGLQPVVTFGEVGNTVVWDTSTVGYEWPKKLTVAVKSGETSAGSLTMELRAEAAAQAVAKSSGESASDETYTLAPNAYELLKIQPYFSSTYTKRTASWLKGNAASTKYLTDPNDTKISASLIATLAGFKLSFPTASIPDAWTATLPISITVK